MKIYNFFQIAFISIMLPRMIYAGTAYYVDPSAGTNGNGTYASPWNNIPSVNNHSMQTGDDVYFKVNTTYTLTADSDRLQVDWGGTSGDRVVIGAYYANGQFGLNGNARPIIDGDSNSYPSTYQAMITMDDDSIDYITVRDLRLQYSGAYGVRAGRSDNINVDNCYIYRPTGNAIVYGSFQGGVNTGVISNNIVENIGYPDYSGGGAAIEIFSGNVEGNTTNITVQYNEVFASKLEGIGLYKKVTNSIVEYNTVHDIKNVNIYIDAGQYNVVRYNLLYNYVGIVPWWGGAYGIDINNESGRPYCFSGNNEVYGNLIAGMLIGLSLGCQEQEDDASCICHENTKIYNNTIVDCTHNFRYWTPTSGDSVEIKNNISWTISDGTNHAHNYSPAGVTWSHNLFDEAVSGNAANNAVIGNPLLIKTSGWRNLSPGALSPDDFKLSSIDSAAHNAGTDLGSSPYNIDYWGTNRDANSPWDIGSHEYTNGDTTPPAKPTGLNIIE